MLSHKINSTDQLESLLHDRFSRRHKIVIPGDRGVLTATDANLFVGLQLLFYSLSLSHDVQFACFDLGLTERQKAWCSKNDINLLDIPADDLIFPDRTARGWQNWNKPVWIEHSPFQETLWLDADTIVRGSLVHPFEVTSRRPFIVECRHVHPGFTNANNPSLYSFSKQLFVTDHLATFPNSGVLGLNPQRDRDLMEKWKFAISQATVHPSLRKFFAWFDQGALVWALEATRNASLVRSGETAYNCPGRDPGAPGGYGCDDVSALLRSLPQVDGAVVRHYTGATKPWSSWKPHVKSFPIDLSDSISRKMKVLVLGHCVNSRPYTRSYLEDVNLSELDGGNELAESRVYLDPRLMDRFDGREYVGLASARWDEKYSNFNSPPLKDLHEFRAFLEPESVLAAWTKDADLDWVSATCKFNHGLELMLDELAEFTGMPLLNGPSFWSNNFICHRDVFQEYLTHFLKVYDHFWKKYRNRFPFRGVDEKRTPAFFYEAVTVHYFANRTDLTIKRLRKDFVSK